MVPNPISQPCVHLGHGDVPPWMVYGVAFLLCDCLTPGADINAMAWCTIPTDQRAARGLHKWRVELAFAGDVAQHLRQAADAAGDRHAGGVGEGLVCQPLEELDKDLSCAALGGGARIGLGRDEVQEAGPQPTLTRLATGWCAGCGRGLSRGWLVSALHLQLAKGCR